MLIRRSVSLTLISSLVDLSLIFVGVAVPTLGSATPVTLLVKVSEWKMSVEVKVDSWSETENAPSSDRSGGRW
jgi:hypothetical protein